MTTNSIYDIAENEITIEGKPWNDSMVQQLAWKNIYIAQRMIDYWQPYLDRGQKLFEMYDGKILDATRRAIYEEIEDKITIEPPIMKASIRALLGHAIQAKKSGAIGVEEGDMEGSGPNPIEIETVDICLKFMEKKTKEQLKLRDAIHDSMVSCYPNVLLFQERKPTGDNPLKRSLEHPAWNSVVLGPINTSSPDYSDFTEMVYMRQYSMAQLIQMYPKMKENIIAHWHSSKKDDKQLAAIMNWDSVTDATETAYLNSIYNAAYGNIVQPSGLAPTFMRLCQIKSKEEVYIVVNIGDEDEEEIGEHIILPENWSKKRKQGWADKNKDKFEGPYEKEVNVLWQCVFTSTGLMLSNKKHWFQESGMLPAVVVVPCIINGAPSGPAVDMAPETLRNCVARIEFLDDMRKGDGQLLITKEGTFTRESNENLTAEANKSLGVAYVNKDYQGSIREAYAIERREASNAWRNYSEVEKNEMNEITRINETMQGEAAPRQSGVAKTSEIGQALVVSALYFDNFNQQCENLQNLKLAMIRYNYDEEMMQIEGFFAKENATKATTLNTPQYDVHGDKVSIINDVTSNRYRWMVSPVDDSPNAKSRYMQDALMIINGSAGPLMQSDPTGKLLSSFWSALDNPILNEAGKKLAQDTQQKQQTLSQQQQQKVQQEAQVAMIKAMADAEKAKKAGVSLSFTGEQLMQYPTLGQFYQQLMAQNQVQPPPQPGQGQSPEQQPGQPTPQGQPNLPPQVSPQNAQGGGASSPPAKPAAVQPHSKG